MDIKIFLILIVATSLETAGDASVRMGMSQTAWTLRGGLFLAGAGLLFGYGFCLNLPPVEFGRIVGLYIATLFIVWQITNFVVFGSLPEMQVDAISQLAREDRVNAFRRFAFMKSLIDVEGIPIDRLVDPFDNDRLHGSDWVTGRIASALQIAIADGVKKARASMIAKR